MEWALIIANILLVCANFLLAFVTFLYLRETKKIRVITSESFDLDMSPKIYLISVGDHQLAHDDSSGEVGLKININFQNLGNKTEGKALYLKYRLQQKGRVIEEDRVFVAPFLAPGGVVHRAIFFPLPSDLPEDKKREIDEMIKVSRPTPELTPAGSRRCHSIFGLEGVRLEGSYSYIDHKERRVCREFSFDYSGYYNAWALTLPESGNEHP